MVNLFDRIRQTVCGFHGHDALLQFERERVYLKCFSCGFESPGWTVKERGRESEPRRPLVQTGFVDARRVA